MKEDKISIHSFFSELDRRQQSSQTVVGSATLAAAGDTG